MMYNVLDILLLLSTSCLLVGMTKVINLIWNSVEIWLEWSGGVEGEKE